MTKTEKLLCEVFDHLMELTEKTGKVYLPYKLQRKCLKQVLYIRRREDDKKRDT